MTPPTSATSLYAAPHPGSLGGCLSEMTRELKLATGCGLCAVVVTHPDGTMSVAAVDGERMHLVGSPLDSVSGVAIDGCSDTSTAFHRVLTEIFCDDDFPHVETCAIDIGSIRLGTVLVTAQNRDALDEQVRTELRRFAAAVSPRLLTSRYLSSGGASDARSCLQVATELYDATIQILFTMSLAAKDLHGTLVQEDHPKSCGASAIVDSIGAASACLRESMRNVSCGAAACSCPVHQPLRDAIDESNP